MLDYSIKREIYLVFIPTNDSTFFYSRFLKEGFKHVFAIERQALGWICIDPSQCDLLTLILPGCYDSKVPDVLKQNNPAFTIVKLNPSIPNKKTYPKLGLISCVGAIQYYLGIYKPFIITPYQLYNYVIKQDYFQGCVI